MNSGLWPQKKSRNFVREECDNVQKLSWRQTTNCQIFRARNLWTTTPNRLRITNLNYELRRGLPSGSTCYWTIQFKNLLLYNLFRKTSKTNVYMFFYSLTYSGYKNNTQQLVPVLLGHFRALKMRPLDCLETSRTNHLVKPRHISEKCRHQLNRCKSQKLKIMLIALNECGTSSLVLKVGYYE